MSELLAEPPWKREVQTVIDELAIGDLIHLHPDNKIKYPWRVAARNEEHVVLVRQAPFHKRGEMEYCIIAWSDYRYNSQGPGPIRTTLNTLGGGYDVGGYGIKAQAVIDELESGQLELSNRRRLAIWEIKVVEGKNHV